MRVWKSACLWAVILGFGWACTGDHEDTASSMDGSTPPTVMQDAAMDSGLESDARPRRLDAAAPVDAMITQDGRPATDAEPQSPTDMGPVGLERQIFTGTTSDERTLAGIIIAGNRISFYGCGAGETLANHTWWLAGEVSEDGTVSLSDEADFRLDGQVVDDRFQGTYRIPESDEVLDLDLPRAGPMDRSEVYQFRDGECLMGVVVVENREDTPKIQGAWCDGEGLFLQVTPILPFAPDERGLEVSVEFVDGPRRFFVTPTLED